MEKGLTARQTQILKSIIDEYIETATPVGSESLEKKYDLGVSPATVRNEMFDLARYGYLKQPHTSAGRVPTPKAMKFYVDQLMEEKRLSLADEVKTKEEVWDSRDDTYALMREATVSLAHRTRSLAVSVLDEGRVWHAGYANIFTNPEFSDLSTSASLFSLIEESSRLQEIFFEQMTGENPVEVFFCEDMGWTDLSPIGIVATRFKIHGQLGALGVVGSTRLSYPTIVPTLRYFRNLIYDIAGS
jgi:heat-inducible transcriptional repressor